MHYKKKTQLLLYLLSTLTLFINCQNFGKLTVKGELPSILEEVSGIEKNSTSNTLYMINDSGNASSVYEVNTQGQLIKEINIKAKNHDWEDLTTDDQGNLYIADFGNNANKRDNLVILKVTEAQLLSAKKIKPQKIKFSYPEQKKFPPKKKERFFDAESLLYKDGYLYIFTKSRVKNVYGTTNLYRVPTEEGNYKAEFINSFSNCDDDLACWITAAAISPNKDKIALLNHKSVLVFSNFKGDNFFNGTLTEYPFNHESQKESLSFKDNNTLYITDEVSGGKGGYLYEFSLDK